MLQNGKIRKIKDSYKNEAEKRNNDRNADTFAIAKSNNMLNLGNESDKKTKIETGVNKVLSTNPTEVEDTLITLIDLKDKMKRISDSEGSEN